MIISKELRGMKMEKESGAQKAMHGLRRDAGGFAWPWRFFGIGGRFADGLLMINSTSEASMWNFCQTQKLYIYIH